MSNNNNIQSSTAKNTAKIYKYQMASTREQRLIDIYTEGKVWISHMK